MARENRKDTVVPCRLADKAVLRRLAGLEGSTQMQIIADMLSKRVAEHVAAGVPTRLLMEGVQHGR